MGGGELATPLPWSRERKEREESFAEFSDQRRVFQMAPHLSPLPARGERRSISAVITIHADFNLAHLSGSHLYERRVT